MIETIFHYFCSNSKQYSLIQIDSTYVKAHQHSTGAKKRGRISVIPPRKNRKKQREYDKDIYKNRNQIERFFNRLKQFRRIAIRYDKLLSSFLSLVQLAIVFITIPKFPIIV